MTNYHNYIFKHVKRNEVEVRTYAPTDKFALLIVLNCQLVSPELYQEVTVNLCM